MRVAVIMLGRHAGGIEQALVDYARALRLRGHDVVAVVGPTAWVNAQLAENEIPTHHLTQRSFWDIFAIWRLRSLLTGIKPDAVITHGNRAFSLSKYACGCVPLLFVANNYSIRCLKKAAGVLTVSRDLSEYVAGRGIDRDKIFHIPNMIECATALPLRPARRQPPVIGAMGRFVAKKGFDVFIRALALLKQEGIAFRALIGGDGEEKETLHALVQELRLAEQVTFTGWVKDKQAFYRDIDIFCVPSLHEPFGIVLLEAFSAGVPVVATDSEGPSEIIEPGFSGLLAEKGNARALADQLSHLLKDDALAQKISEQAFLKVKKHYSMEVVGERIEQAIFKSRR